MVPLTDGCSIFYFTATFTIYVQYIEFPVASKIDMVLLMILKIFIYLMNMQILNLLGKKLVVHH